MKNPNPVNLQTSDAVHKAGWQAETRDADGHLCRAHAPFETDEDIVWLVREALEHGETVTIWPSDTPAPAQTQPVEAQGDVAVAIRHIWTPSNNDGVAWRDVPQHLKDAAKEYRKAIEPATIHHHGKVSGEVFWGYAVEWAFVAGVLSAAPQPAVAVGEVERLREALETLRDGYGPNHLSRYVRTVASKALAAYRKEAAHE